MRKTILASAMAAAFGMAGVASAGPLGPGSPAVNNLSLSTFAGGTFASPHATTCGGFSCIAGEGAAVNSLIGLQNPLAATGVLVPDTAIQHMDWIVRFDGGPTGFGVNPNDDYLYMYQIENSSIAALGGATIATPAGFSFSLLFSAATVPALVGSDLDLAAGNPAGVGHDLVTFANLGVPRAVTTTFLPGTSHNGAGKVELELTPQLATIDPDSVLLTNGDILALFPGLAVGRESSIYGGRGTRPVYGPWNTQGDAFTWNSENPNPCTGPNGKVAPTGPCEQGLRVPVPGPGVIVPEPASLLLLASGLLGLGAWTRRRRQS